MKRSPQEYSLHSAFSLLELLFIIAIITVVISQITIKPQNNNLDLALKQIKLYLNYTRYIAHIDNKYSLNDNEWKKRLWTLKFQRCSSSIGGLYFVIYSDTSGGTAHFKKEESLKDPLSNKYLYSNYDCKVSKDESRYILLTKEYGIEKVEVSCNSTNTIGQISFAYDGKVYSKLGNNPTEIIDRCYIKIYDKDNRSRTLTIEPKTGYIF
ncbi:MAG: type II secretion system protein [Campylobacterota bacterium]|nr:type II secretion system protein [Campylobacterota bacterium]